MPELWPDVLDSIAETTESAGSHLITARGLALNWTSTHSLQSIISDYISKGWFARCGRRVCIFKDAHSSFLRETDYWTDDEFENNEVYQDLFRPRGWGWSAGTGFLVPTGDTIAFFVERALDEGPVDAQYIDYLNELRPHLARSVMVATRLGLKNAEGASDAMAKLDVPTFLLGSDCSVVNSHNIDDATAEHFGIGAKDRLYLKDATANVQLTECLKEFDKASDRDVSSFPVRDELGQALFVGHVIPVSRSVHDIFANSYAVLVLIPTKTDVAPKISLVRSLYDFTGAEARIARGLAKGQSLDDLAASANVAKSTVRTQLKSVMEKTGCTRQAELVALMKTVMLKRGVN